MARGQEMPVGSTRVSANGYHYTKVEDVGDGRPGWKLTHHIVAEQMLGRKLENGERVSFKTGKKLDLRPSNITVTLQGRSSLRRRKARLESRIAELQVELAEVEAELAL